MKASKLQPIDRLIAYLVLVDFIILGVIFGVLNYHFGSDVLVFAATEPVNSQASVLSAEVERNIPEIIFGTATPTPSPTPEPTSPVYGTPINLRIDKIALDAKIISIGLTAEGSLESPKNLNDIGWYQDAGRPGEWGSAVFDGHSGVSTPGVFRNLHQLSIGDIITVTDDLGNILNFSVRELKTYPRDAQVPEIYTKGKEAYLNLITCDGVYVYERGGTLSRLVVFTDLVEE